MTVDELIERLTEIKTAGGGDAEVHIGMQQSYPFECDMAGVVQRYEFASDDETDCEVCGGDGEIGDDDCHECCGSGQAAGGDMSPEWKAEREDGLNHPTLQRGDDVFLLEGSQLRYGSRDMWDSAR